MISRSFFRKAIWFLLGAFAWSGYIQITMFCGVIPKPFVFALVTSVIGLVGVVYAIRHEDQWFADAGEDGGADE